MNDAEDTKAFWSNGFGARLYRKYASRQYAKMHQIICATVIERGAKNVLDIACGPGDFLFRLFNLEPGLHLVGTDLSPGMVIHAREKLRDKATIVEVGIDEVSFPNESFDVVTIMMAFHHFPQKLQALIKIKKLLRPNGILIVADVVAKSDAQKKFWNILEKVSSVRGYVGHYTETDMRELAEKSGFSLDTEHIFGMANRYRIYTLASE